METIMRTISSAPAAARGTLGHSRGSELAATLKRWWLACITWRLQQAAIAVLCSMGDRELGDIGLARCDIARAVRSEMAGERAFSRRPSAPRVGEPLDADRWRTRPAGRRSRCYQEPPLRPEIPIV
jgi:uncharacterized protein YjiS (DUF1127 family)